MMRRKNKLSALAMFVITCFLLISGSEVQGARVTINLSPNVERQFNVWLNESQGIYDWLSANPGSDSNSLWYQMKGEADLYQFLLDNNGRAINTNTQLTDRMLDAAERVSGSYAGRPDYTYFVQAVSTTRSELHDYFNEVLTIGGRQAITRVDTKYVAVLGVGKGNTQYGIPIGGGSNVRYTEGAGDGDADWFDELDEGFGAGRGDGSGPDDSTTYWRSGDNPQPDFIDTIVTDSTFEDPLTSSGHIVRSRDRKNSSGGKQIDLDIVLREGGTPRATFTFTDINEVWTTRENTLSAAQANSIGNYTGIRVRSLSEAVGGGAARHSQVTAHEFEFPDAPVGAPTSGSYGWIY